MTARSSRPALRLIGALVAVQLVAGVLFAPSASAAPPPIMGPLASQVTTDVLPTAQIDGVVWSQAVVGDTVFVGGQFGKARPAGAAPGSNTVTRNNLLSFDITTGVLKPFNPSLNSQVKAVATSPNGTRVYVGGSFTSVSGTTRNRIAAFDVATGALISSFSPSINYNVNAIAATDTTVYVGGQFTSVNGTTRNRLAAFQASNGALLGWNPNANGTVYALALGGGGARVVAGGNFSTVGGQGAYGMAALDPSTAAVRPWAITSLIRNAGPNAAILSLKADGDRVYGNGYKYGSGGNFEGAFAVNGTTGALIWLEDCHGDTYDIFPTNGVLYVVSHAHYCATLNGFPDSNPRSIYMRRATAFTQTVTGTLKRNTGGSSYTNFEGNPSPSLTTWFPEMQAGSYTGKTQAAWSVTGNTSYIVLGGEFPRVNGINQQGLVRFAVKPIAPAKVGPKLTGANFVPTLSAVSNGVRLTWPANHDNDDYTLTYRIVRNNVTIKNDITGNGTFWNQPTMSYTDTTAAPGVTYTYRLQAVDDDGNVATGDTRTITRPAGAARLAAPEAGADAFGALVASDPVAPTPTTLTDTQTTDAQAPTTTGASDATAPQTTAPQTTAGEPTTCATATAPAPTTDNATPTPTAAVDCTTADAAAPGTEGTAVAEGTADPSPTPSPAPTPGSTESVAPN